MAKKHSTTQPASVEQGPAFDLVAALVNDLDEVTPQQLLDMLTQPSKGGLAWWLWWRAVDWTLLRIAQGEQPHIASPESMAFIAQFEQLRTQQCARVRDALDPRTTTYEQRRVTMRESLGLMMWADDDDRVKRQGTTRTA